MTHVKIAKGGFYPRQLGLPLCKRLILCFALIAARTTRSRWKHPSRCNGSLRIARFAAARLRSLPNATAGKW